MRRAIFKKILFFCLILIVVFWFAAFSLQKKLISIYQEQESSIVKDREGRIVAILPNEKGYYNYYIDDAPQKLKQLLIKQEDKFFYYHLGFNPVSVVKAGLGQLGIGHRRGSSTITQQLVKNLLGQEMERSPKNKITELFYAVSLEIFQSKKEILNMYLNSAYFGNQAQGIYEASQLYFNLPPELLTDGQVMQLLASISSPSKNNPGQADNQIMATNLAKALGLDNKNLNAVGAKEVQENIANHRRLQETFFEISPFLNDSFKDCQITVDQLLTEKIREIVKRNIDALRSQNAKNAAVVVIKLPENEALALVGSPNPDSFEESYKINMINQVRAIGSTIKPFIYLKAFEKDLRPYTLVDDREYKYGTALDLPLYPKNFDYTYRGIVNLHYALSNSLNVPAVKVLEYVGLENFYQFLAKDLGFNPVQSFENYQLGIALGALEMNLLDLSRYFTIFANNGFLKDLTIFKSGDCKKEQAITGKQIADSKYIQLINKILNDRKTGMELFGMKSELNLFQGNYALKTGTSRDFRDSWIVGYTPDFLVGVWVGNADNSPTNKISGQVGAGSIWQTVMELLLNSEYNKKTPFVFNEIKEFNQNKTIEYGLPNDDYEKQKNILLKSDTALILLPHQGDVFLLEEDTTITLKAKESVQWLVNGKLISQSQEASFSPILSGRYQIEAKTSTNSEKIEVIVMEQ